MILPTRKLVLLLLVAAAAAVAMPTTLAPAFLLICNLLIAGLVLADLTASIRPQQITVRRDMPVRMSLGGGNRIGWELHNAGRLALDFRITDDVPEGIETSTEIVQGRLPSQSRALLRYVVRPTRRGHYEFGDVHIRWRSLLGLLTRQQRFAMRTAVKVYPNVANLARYELALRKNRLADLGLKSARLYGKGTMFESLREYVPGDDPGDMAWKATARRGRPILRNFEAERSQNILLVIDCGRLMTTQVEGLTRLDYAINASILLTYVAMKQGDYIGMVAFSDRIEGYMPPTRGRGALGRMNDALYRLEPRLAEPNYEQACRFLSLRHRKRSLIVIFTDVIDKDASSMLLAYAARFARQHLPMCVVMKNREIEGLAGATPRSSDDVFTKSVALQMLSRRTDALTRMRHFGVDVLDTDPQTLTPDVLNRYLALKRRLRF